MSKKKLQQDTFTVLYKCDPALNTPCSKTHCHLNGGPCTETTHINYAKKPVGKVRMITPPEQKTDVVEWDERIEDFIDEEADDE
jgi:hypothetical protein